MVEWWTYGLSDFLMFSPRVHARLVESYNRALWPVHLPVLAAAAAMLAHVARGGGRRWVPALLAAAWLWVAWAFHHQRYAGINWGAQWLAAASGVQAGLLLVFAAIGRRRTDPEPATVPWLPVALAAFALVLYPLVAPALGQPWARSEVAGIMPDPTALFTVGIVLTLPANRGWRIVLAVLPALALGVGLATHVAMWQAR